MNDDSVLSVIGGLATVAAKPLGEVIAKLMVLIPLAPTAIGGVRLLGGVWRQHQVQVKAEYISKLKALQTSLKDDGAPGATAAYQAVSREIEDASFELTKLLAPATPANAAVLPGWRRYLLLFLPQGRLAWAAHSLYFTAWGLALAELFTSESPDIKLLAVMGFAAWWAGVSLAGENELTPACIRPCRPAWQAALLWYPPASLASGVLHSIHWVLLVLTAFLAIGTVVDPAELHLMVLVLSASASVGLVVWMTARRRDDGRLFSPSVPRWRRVLGLYVPWTPQGAVALGWAGTVAAVGPYDSQLMVGHLFLFGVLRVVAFASEERLRFSRPDRPAWQRMLLCFPPQSVSAGLAIIGAYLCFPALISLCLSPPGRSIPDADALTYGAVAVVMMALLGFAARSLDREPSGEPLSTWQRPLAFYAPNRQIVWILQLALWLFCVVAAGMAFIPDDEPSAAHDGPPEVVRRAAPIEALPRDAVPNEIERAFSAGEETGEHLGESAGGALAEWVWHTGAGHPLLTSLGVVLMLRFLLFALEGSPPAQIRRRALAETLFLTYRPDGSHLSWVHVSFYGFLLLILGVQVPSLVEARVLRESWAVLAIDALALLLIHRTARAGDTVRAQPHPAQAGAASAHA